MAINLTKVLTQIQNRISDSATSARDLNKLIAAASRINNSGTQVLTYQSTGQLPSLADSNYVGVIARVATDNVFGDSDGRYYYASGTDSGWRGFKTTQDSADALIEAPAGETPTATIVMGTTSAFLSGGYPQITFIDKFSLAASASSAATGGTLSVPRFQSGSVGQVSATHGYNAGGYSPSNSAYRNDIVKYPFAISSGTSTDVGDLTNTGAMGGASSPTHGYSLGAEPQVNVIQKFSTASDGNATDVGDLFNPNKFMAGASSSTHGYSAGGRTPPPGHTDTIEKFSFSSDGNATDVGNLANPVYDTTANSSSTHGYVNGGQAIPGEQVNIIKWSFASDGNGTDVGDNTLARTNLAGHNSTEHGYASGGTSQNVIDRFPFAADGNATDVGDLRVPSTYSHNGTQN